MNDLEFEQRGKEGCWTATSRFNGIGMSSSDILIGTVPHSQTTLTNLQSCDLVS
jgi:hypothetical protein